jgi:hypothetical protein
VIRNFTLAGIDYNTDSPAAQIFVSNTTISENGTGVRFLFASGGSGTTNCVLDHVRIVNGSVDGLSFTTTSTQQNINVTVTDSVIANNASAGIDVVAANGAKANVMVRNTTIANNGAFGLIAQGSVASIRITRSTITANGHGWTNNTGGQVTSYFDNNIEDNGADNGDPVQIPEK